MKKLIFLYIVLVLAIAFGLHLEKDPGYVLISLGHWTIETSLWFALLSLFLLFGLIYFTLQFIRAVGSMKYRWYQFRLRRKTKISNNKTKQGLIAFSEGAWQKAETNLIKALSSSEVPLINYIVAARCAQELKNPNRRDKYLKSAERAMPDAKIAVLLTKAQLQLASQEWRDARECLNHLHTLVPKHPYVMKLMLSLYLEEKDWQGLSILIPKLRRYHVVNDEKLLTIEKTIYQGLLDKAAKEETVKHLFECWQAIPKSFKSQPSIVYIFAKHLLGKNEQSHAESILRQTLKSQFNENLIDLYGKTRSHALNKQLSFAETFLKKQAESAALFLCLGRICIHLKLWGKAKTYLEQSIHFNATPEAYNLLAKLLEQLNEEDMAQNYYRLGLEAAV